MVSVLDEHNHQQYVQCNACEHFHPASDFWPRHVPGPSNTMKSLGRWEICRYCAASMPREMPKHQVWNGESFPTRQRLRDRVNRDREAEGSDE